MTPKDKLISELSVFLHDAFHAGFNAENVSELHNFDGFAEAEEAVNNYAIGRWVSVEERLPSDGAVVITKWSNGFISYYTFRKGEEWCVRATDSEVTHWLELEMTGGAE